MSGISESPQPSFVLLNGRSVAHFPSFPQAQYHTHWFMTVFEQDFTQVQTFHVGTLLDRTRRLLPSSVYYRDIFFICTILP